jgi:cytochrome c553
LITGVLLAVLLLAACGDDPPTAAPTATTAPTSTVTPAEVPTLATTVTPVVATESAVDPDEAGLPENILTALATADPARGQELTVRNGCIGCHAVDPAVKMAGPTWHNLATTAATRVAGQSTGLYLYHSVANPNDYVVEGYPAGLMIQTFAATLSDQEMADILAYLLTLREAN